MADAKRGGDLTTHTLPGEPGRPRPGPPPGIDLPGSPDTWSAGRVERAVLRGLLYTALGLSVYVVVGLSSEGRYAAEPYLTAVLSLVGLAASARD